MKIRAHIIVIGRVQGVGYRAFTADKATSLELSGWVKNRADGSVEAVFEGDKASIDAMLRQCRQGPPFSYISDIKSDFSSAPEGFSGFRILY